MTDICDIVFADLHQLVDLDFRITGTSREGFHAKRLTAAAGNPSNFILLGVAEQKRLRGFVSGHILDGEFGGAGPVGVLDALGVDKEHRGKGMARTLLSAAEAELRRRGVAEVVTQADWSEHRLVRFFANAGFQLLPRLVLDRETGMTFEFDLPETKGRSGEVDLSDPSGDDFAALSRDVIPVRSLAADDSPFVVAIDRKATGRDRSSYYRHKISEALNETGVRVSLVAELDGQFAGFIMARVDFGEFGRADTKAVIDTIGVDPAFARRHVGRALISQLLTNLYSLGVEKVQTQAAWNDFSLLGFLSRCGFQPSQRLVLRKALG